MKIVIASNNLGKFAEFEALLSSLPLTFVSQQEFQVPAIAETGLSFIENALLKARNAAKYTQLPALGDDSGLVVEALNGAPGIYSSRFAGENATDAQNIQKLILATQALSPNEKQAAFYCALAFVRTYDDPIPLICQAKWEGTLLDTPQGENGFGYDPIFFVPEFNCSAAALSPSIKNQISHRAKAFLEFSHQFSLL